MNILSVLNTCIVINLYYKRLSLEYLHPWLRWVFFRLMPRLLLLNRNKQATADATRERIASLSTTATTAFDTINESIISNTPSPIRRQQQQQHQEQHQQQQRQHKHLKQKTPGGSRTNRRSMAHVYLTSTSTMPTTSSRATFSTATLPLSKASKRIDKKKMLKPDVRDSPISNLGGGNNSRVVFSATGQRRVEVVESPKLQLGIKKSDSNDDILLVSSEPDSGGLYRGGKFR